MASRLTARTITSSSRVLAAIPLAALAVAGSLTAASQSGVSSVVPVAAPHTKPAATPAPQPLAPVAVAPAAADAATAWNGTARKAVDASATSSEIPAAALSAYQRAATTIDTAAPGCHLDWTFLAAIGKVESNHGSGRLDAQGVARPAIIGPALTGRNGTAAVADSDGGVYDGDPTYDHAVGPMQILPATWAAVGVDADGDGQRNPQDIDDAALAAAVFLCSSGGDLGTPAGQQAAALRYNPAPWYADSVLSIMNAYATSADTANAGSFVSAVYLPARALAPSEIVPLTPLKAGEHHHAIGHTPTTVGASSVPSPAPTATVPTSAPASSSAASGAAGGAPSAPTPAPTDPAAPGAPTAPAAPASPAAPADDPATADQLETLCAPAIAKAYPDATADVQQQATDACVRKLTGKTPDEAQAALPDVVTDLPQTVPGLAPLTSTGPAEPTGTADPTQPTDPANSEPSTESTPGG